jgi:Zn finger protein HypA/HybF involved in hydrogenase expression
VHEFGITESIIRSLLAQLEREQVERVQSVRFRRSSAFAEHVLRQTFEVLSAGTPLERAELDIDVRDVTVTCPQCGASGEANSENLAGHIYICPHCCAVREVKEAHDLELIEVRTVL